MKKTAIPLLLPAILFSAFVAAASASAGSGRLPPPPVARASDSGMAGMSVVPGGPPATFFIANQGQAHPAVRFYARTATYSLWLADEGLVFDLAGRRPQPAGGSPLRSVVRLRFPGARPRPEVAVLEPSPVQVNILRGSDPAVWRRGVAAARAVVYRDLYPGISLEVRGQPGAVEYDWRLAPGAAPEAICMEVQAAGRVRIDGDGDLVIASPAGDLRHRRPLAFQDEGGRRTPVKAAFRRLAGNRFGFSVGAYDRRRPLVIDPLVLDYATYLGGSGNEYGQAIASDGAGRVTVAGNTFSTDFPVAGGGDPASGDQDVFVARLAAGSAGNVGLQFATYLGGNDLDNCGAIEMDAAGNVWVTGSTSSSDFPQLNPVQSRSTGSDAFLVRIDPTGGAQALAYATCLGGSGNEQGTALALGGDGAVVVAGYTTSPDFPVNDPARTYSGAMDIFVARLDPARSGSDALLYATCFGGRLDDRAAGVSLDGQGRIVVAGSSRSEDFPTLGPAFTPQGSWDAVVFILDPGRGGSDALVYSTCLGGAGSDTASGMALGNGGLVYLAGSTDSPSFPIVNGCMPPAGSTDAFLALLDPQRGGADSLRYATCLGGTDYDFATGLAVNGYGHAFLCGYTASDDFPLVDGLQPFQGLWDAFVARINPVVSGPAGLYNSSCLGGRGADYGRGVDRDDRGVVHLVGYTLSADLPRLRSTRSPGGWLDAFVAGVQFIDPLLLTLQASAHGTTVPAPGGYPCRRDEVLTIQAVPAVHALFTGWSGDASGLANPLTVVMDASKTIVANFREIGPPLSPDGRRTVNRSSLLAEYINVLSWQANPANDGLGVSAYRVYEGAGAPALLAELPATKTEYVHRQAGKGARVYTLVAVCGGTEGVATTVAVD